MKTSTLLLGGLGSSAAFLGFYLYWNSKSGDAENEKRENCDKPRKNLRQRKLSFRVNIGDGLDAQDPDAIHVIETRLDNQARSLAGTNTPREDLPDDNASIISFPSITSFDSSVAGGDPMGNTSNNSLSESDSGGIPGAVGLSTYNSMSETLGLSENLDELVSSPVVTPMFTDRRFERHVTSDERDACASPVVVEYGGSLAPIDVNDNIESYSGTYSGIVPPLEPNTGTVIPSVMYQTREP